MSNDLTYDVDATEFETAAITFSGGANYYFEMTSQSMAGGHATLSVEVAKSGGETMPVEKKEQRKLTLEGHKEYETFVIEITTPGGTADDTMTLTITKPDDTTWTSEEFTDSVTEAELEIVLMGYYEELEIPVGVTLVVDG